MKHTPTIRSVFLYLRNQPFVQTTQTTQQSFKEARVRSPKEAATMRRYLWMSLLAVGAHLSMQTPAVVAQTAAEDMVETTVVAAEKSAMTVNINTASADELAHQLNGVGGSRAEAIVRYREQFGPFESVDELSEVAGIGTSTVERNRSLLSTQ